MLCSCFGDWDVQLKDVRCGCSLYCLLGFWFCPWCPRQRRCYPRTEPHGTRRNGRVGIRANILLLYTWANGYVGVSVFCLFISRGGYMNSGTSQSLSGALNRQNQLMQGGGMQGGAFGRRYWAPPHHFGLCTYFFFKKLTSETVPVHFLMETCIFLVYFVPLCDVVISDIVKHPSLYIVCTAPLSAGMCHVSSLAL